jgi:hypothetical protein
LHPLPPACSSLFSLPPNLLLWLGKRNWLEMESIFFPDDLIPISTPRGLLHLIPGSIAVPRTNDTLNLTRGEIQTSAVTSVTWGFDTADTACNSWEGFILCLAHSPTGSCKNYTHKSNAEIHKLNKLQMSGKDSYMCIKMTILIGQRHPLTGDAIYKLPSINTNNLSQSRNFIVYFCHFLPLS